ncbi:TPA: DUF551 domain-containing protein [Escherichia coli]|nr:DUF551 domain-containing protein [Escherichia coli]MCZ5567232.1 DUF551 domain-containing protein [Escherichia coli]MCZ5833076.1 DUF551 domain-containing protein [Escherichia coli]HCP3633712.1 DUF551 domain-containing protein [Escherichia coli]
MTTITKERLLTIKQWRETYGPGSNVVLPAEEAEELARIALASLEAEKVTLYRERNPYNGMTTGWQELTEQEYEFVKDNASENAEFRTVYTAPPATVVPDERAAFNAWNNDENLPIAGVGAKNAAWLAWQARAELGRSLAVNSPVTPDGWISCSERMPEETGDIIVVSDGIVMSGISYSRRDGFYIAALEYDDDEPIDGVTHWMPLPEPPQEVRQ